MLCFFIVVLNKVIIQEEEEEEEEQAKMKESVSSQKDVALEEMSIPTARDAREQAKAKTLEKHEQLCELSRALAVLASASVRTRIVCFMLYIFMSYNLLSTFFTASFSSL
jgi:LETM1 and EF-hand domain-containing protein 1